MEYIKKVRACIRWLLEREDINLAEIKRINGQLEATHKQHSEIGGYQPFEIIVTWILAFFYILLTEFLLLHIVADLENNIEETKSVYEELQKQCASLQEALKIVEAEKMVGDSCLWLNIILLLFLRHSQFH